MFLDELHSARDRAQVAISCLEYVSIQLDAVGLEKPANKLDWAIKELSDIFPDLLRSYNEEVKEDLEQSSRHNAELIKALLDNATKEPSS